MNQRSSSAFKNTSFLCLVADMLHEVSAQKTCLDCGRVDRSKCAVCHAFLCSFTSFALFDCPSHTSSTNSRNGYTQCGVLETWRDMFSPARRAEKLSSISRDALPSSPITSGRESEDADILLYQRTQRLQFHRSLWELLHNFISSSASSSSATSLAGQRSSASEIRAASWCLHCATRHGLDMCADSSDESAACTSVPKLLVNRPTSLWHQTGVWEHFTARGGVRAHMKRFLAADDVIGEGVAGAVVARKNQIGLSRARSLNLQHSTFSCTARILESRAQAR